MVGTFAVMALLGFNLDNLSLMALTLAVGFVVDDAIVMLENIFRHMEMGKTPYKAAVDGAKEVGFTIVSMTLSLTAVFIPILFLGGIMGRLFREFAVTIMAAILISGFVSLSLTPMMCSRFLKHDIEGEARPVFQRHRILLGHGPWGCMKRASPGWCSRRRATLLFSAVILIATVFLFGVVPKGFIPSEDTGFLNGTIGGGGGALLRGHGASTRRRWPPSWPRIPTSTDSSPPWAAAAAGSSNHGPHVHPAEAQAASGS